MPELPEIEVLRRDLEKEVVGRRIKDVEVRPGTNAMKIIRRHGRRKEFQDLLVGAKVDRIGRSGRRIVFHLDSDHALVVDLGDAGHLFKTSASDPVATNTHIIIAFTIGGQMRIIDPNRSGEVYVTPSADLEAENDSSAIDPLEQQVTWHHFSALLQEQGQPMKDLLMDEKFICGLGDIYSDEILFAAGIKFDRQSDKLSSQDVRRIYRALIEVLQEAVKARGTTWGRKNFRDLHGAPGGWQLELKVYERDGEACRRCRNEIVKEEFKDGFTYFCPQCQS
ncbi:MAG TPA: DNA-formamidopyrimidine glycosylase family protein [Actinomycetota bacterium]|nr:DNA-formamidopyrimidine glycosylase family protein [Actinomycetota bacterium]